MFYYSTTLISIMLANFLSINGQTVDYITCYANNCSTAYGNITKCSVAPGIYYPIPTCKVPAATGLCYIFDWPATNSRSFGCLTQRACPYQYECCASGDRCNCDTHFDIVKCIETLTISAYPIASQRPVIIDTQHVNMTTARYYVYDVWTNFTQMKTNVTFSITNINSSPNTATQVTTLGLGNLFGIEPGASINSAKIFIEAFTNLTAYLLNHDTTTTYTITILATSPGYANDATTTLQVRLDKQTVHAPYLTKPDPYIQNLWLQEDSEVSRKIVEVCAADKDGNLDLYTMCQSLLYRDFYTFNDPSDKFFIKYQNTGCSQINAGDVASSFCVEIWTRSGALFSLRDDSSRYSLQVSFRDKSSPPLYTHAFFNVSILAREDSFWRYCFVCNRSTCPEYGVGPVQRCLPGQHYCCKQLILRGARHFSTTDRFCSSIKADSEVDNIHCCGHNYCNSSPDPRNGQKLDKIIAICLISAMIISSALILDNHT